MTPLSALAAVKPKRRKSQRPEDGLHKAVAGYLGVALPKDAVWTTFPAGGGGKARGGKLKAMGLRPGMPDIVIFHASRSAMFIELKSKRGVLSDAQEDTLDALWRAGCPTAVCRSVDDVREALTGWAVPLKARLT